MGMNDLSTNTDDGRAGEIPTSGGDPAGGNEDPNVLVPEPATDPDPDPVDQKMDDGSSAGVAVPPNCQLVTLNPKSVQSAGGGQAWNLPTGALADDGTNAKSTLSTDKRDSALLVFGGFSGAAIPANANVKGLLVDIDRSAGGTCIKAKTISATVAGGQRPRGDATDPWHGIRSYGDIDDTWGGPIAPTDLGGAFTVAVQTHLEGSAADCNARDARIDMLRVRVFYCVP
jgi:hypothetical protein